MNRFSSVVIRPYQQEDWAAIQSIHDRARRAELGLAGLAQAFVPLREAAVSEGLFDYTVEVALNGQERVVGFVAYTHQELAWLYVEPDAQRQGIGAALVRHVLGKVRCAPVCVEVLCGNEPAKALYEKMGFHTVRIAHGRMPGNEAFQVKVYCMER